MNIFKRFFNITKKIFGRFKNFFNRFKSVETKRKTIRKTVYQEKTVEWEKTTELKKSIRKESFKTTTKRLTITETQIYMYKREIKWIRPKLLQAAINRFYAKKFFSKEERVLLDEFENIELAIRLKEDKPKIPKEDLPQNKQNEWWYFSFDNSSFLIRGKYHIPTKTCYLKMKRGKNKWYQFFKVPYTKMRLLVVADSAGKFMWDWFGRHYSTNPKHWIRGEKA